MSAIGHRRSSPTDTPFVGQVAVNDFYLNPEPVGCADHDDPDCLCDVKFDTTTPVRATPDFLVNVETAEELIQAGCNLWLRLDVLTVPFARRMRDQERHIPLPELPSTDQLQKWAKLVRDGMTQPKAEKLGCDEYTWKMLRALTNKGRSKRRFLDGDLVVKLHDEDGLSVRQIREWFKAERHQAWSYTAISKAYYRVTGNKLRVLTNEQLREERERREAEAFRLYDEEGLSMAEVSRRLGIAEATVQGYFRRRRQARMQAA